MCCCPCRIFHRHTCYQRRCLSPLPRWMPLLKWLRSNGPLQSAPNKILQVLDIFLVTAFRRRPTYYPGPQRYIFLDHSPLLFKQSYSICVTSQIKLTPSCVHQREHVWSWWLGKRRKTNRMVFSYPILKAKLILQCIFLKS